MLVIRNHTCINLSKIAIKALSIVYCPCPNFYKNLNITMSFSTNWDIDYYKTDYESDEHWELRRRFMEVHKEKFPEDELVCLAQVFTNVEFMGCKYPDETMQMVAHLSQEVAKEFREERSKRLQRTFVRASDAAEARAKGRTSKIETPNSQKNESTSTSTSSFNPRKRHLNDRTGNWTSPKQLKSSSFSNKVDLLAGLPFGKFVLYLIGDRNCIQVSGQRSKINVNETEIIVGNKKKVEIIVGGIVAGSGTSLALKEAKQLAFDAAMKRLQEECFTIKLCPNPDRIDISKNNRTITCSLKSTETEEENKIDKNNIGYKMMQKLGWSGGGLGSKKEGRENPVDYLIKNNRRGLGNASGDVNKDYFREMLLNYIKSDDIRDLYFESGFTKDERATLHQIASEKNLKSTSHGKEPNRQLVISKKNITPIQVIEEVILNKNPMYVNKFDVKVPKKLVSQYPDYENFRTA